MAPLVLALLSSPFTLEPPASALLSDGFAGPIAEGFASNTNTGTEEVEDKSNRYTKPSADPAAKSKGRMGLNSTQLIAAKVPDTPAVVYHQI